MASSTQTKMLLTFTRTAIGLGLLSMSAVGCSGCSSSGSNVAAEALDPLAQEPALQVKEVKAVYVPELDSLLFQVTVEGDAGSIVPEPAGQLDGAPVLGYVFPTTLDPKDVGFRGIEGTVALAVTSHPDFDDTPLWDEDGNAVFDDDGVVYHSHWVVLVADERAPGGLAVAQTADKSLLPPTAPMPMYLDSPGFTIIEDGSKLQVLVPLDRVARRTDFEIGSLTALMRVDASGDLPLLAVEKVFSAVGDGSPTTTIENKQLAPLTAWPARQEDGGGLNIVGTDGYYNRSVGVFVLSMNVATVAATNIPTAVGQVDGAPVLGYVFPTTIAPSTVGFQNIDGILALAVTSHPDFDDTPLWDETRDLDYGNDGARYHVHWVVLVKDDKSAAGLTVPSASMGDLPPTAPMAMYLDSPGFHAFADGDALHVLIPGWHLPGIDTFSFDALSARMRVDTSGSGPVLRVTEVVDVLSGDLSLPNTVSR